MKKRITSIILASLLVLTALPQTYVSADAPEDAVAEDAAEIVDEAGPQIQDDVRDITASGTEDTAAPVIQEDAVETDVQAEPETVKNEVIREDTDASASEQTLLTELEDGAVARIGDTEYATLAEAFANAHSSDKIVMIDDSYETTNISGSEVTLDLNGKTVTLGENTSFNVWNNFVIEDTSENKDGKIIGTIYVSLGTFVLNSGNIISSEGTAIGAISESEVSSSVKLNGGKVEGKLAISLSSTGALDVPAESTVVVNSSGESIIATSDQMILDDETGEVIGIDYSSSVHIAGGTFNKTLDSNWIERGYKQYEDGSVRECGAAAVIHDGTETEYSTLALAVADATDGDIVKLLTGSESTEQISLTGKEITLDLNACSYSSTADSAITIGAGGSLVIKDESGEPDITGSIQGGTVTNNRQTAAIIMNNASAKLTVESGKICGGSAAVYTTALNNITVNGGYLEGRNFGIQIYGNNNGDVLTVTGGEIKALKNTELSTYNVTSACGIQMKSGGATVTGGNIYGVSYGISFYPNTDDLYFDLKVSGDETVVEGGGAGIDFNSGTYEDNNNGTVTIKSGTVTGYQDGITSKGGDINIESGTVKGNQHGIYLTGGGTVNVSGGTVKTGETPSFAYDLCAGICTNNIGADINISGDAVVTGPDSSDRYSVEGKGCYGIYNPSNSGKTTVTDGTISGYTAILSGVSEITGGTVTGVNSGVMCYFSDTKITVGGDATVTADKAVLTAARYSNGTYNAEVEITGGTLNGSTYGVSIENTRTTVTVSGGSVTGADTAIKATGSRTGIVTVSGDEALVTGKNAAIDIPTGDVTVTAGEVKVEEGGSDSTAVKINDGSVDMKGGKITNENGNAVEITFGSTDYWMQSGEMYYFYMTDGAILCGADAEPFTTGITEELRAGAFKGIRGGIFSKEPDAKYIADDRFVADNKDAATKDVYPYEISYNVKVVFIAEGAAGSMDDIVAAKGAEVELPECGFETPIGKDFAGWKVGETSYDPGDKIVVNEEVTRVYAQWADHVHDWGEWEPYPGSERSRHRRVCKKDSTHIEEGGHVNGDPVYTWSEDNSTCTATETCSVCGYEASQDASKITETDIQAPKCEEPGSKKLTAEFDNIDYVNQEKTVEIPATGHKSIEKVEKKAATLEEEGYIEHYRCTACEKLFSDADGENEITAEDIVIPKLIDIADMMISGIEDKTYTGKAVTQKAIVESVSAALKEGEDYKVTYKNNVKPGAKAYVIFNGKGKYGGSTSESFRICFDDVPMTHSFKNAVYWACDKGIAAGYSGTKTGLFGIRDDITRGQVVTFLWRAAGKPEPKKKTQTFSDVPVKHAFYKAIQWASEQGITAGYSNGAFGVNDYCTRGQIAMFLWRVAGKPAPAGNTQTFSDVPVKHGFYKAVQWASEQRITAGYSNGAFGVKDTCTRGQCVTFIYRLLN